MKNKRYILEQGKKQKLQQYSAALRNARPDLNAQQTSQQILDIPDSKMQKAVYFWILKGTFSPPFDTAKLNKVMQRLSEKRADFQSYNSPDEVLADIGEINSNTPIDPDTCPQLTNKKQLGNGVTVYDVQDDQQGQQKMRQIINTHLGEKANPWCLLHGDGKGNLTDGTNRGYDAWDYWQRYSMLRKRVAFQNGRLLAFSANDSEQLTWWNIQDNPFIDIPCKGAPVFDKDGYMAMPQDLRKKSLAQSKCISPEDMQEMILHGQDQILYGIALNTKTPPHVLDQLSSNQNDLIRIAVAQNQSTSKETRQKLLNDNNQIVKWYAKTYNGDNTPIKAEDVWRIIFGLPPNTVFKINYSYLNHPEYTTTRRGMMHQSINVKGTGVSTINAHSAWNNLKYWDLDAMAYRSCSIPLINWIQFRNGKHRINHLHANPGQPVITESAFGRLLRKIKNRQNI